MVFYSFHSADVFPDRKPLFVFFNGGPGCPTTNGLMGLNTAPFSLDKKRTGGKLLNVNPYSWTSMGNLLYIDAPNTGFSYNLMNQPSDELLRAKEFDVQNYNPFIDASQMVRMVLRFLAAHPDLQNNPVILVGESYAGVRVTTMLNLLLNYPAYGDGSRIYQDKTLAQEIQAHFDKLNPAIAGKTFAPALVARQFGRQILIEPQLTGKYFNQTAGQIFEQKGSVIYQIAAQTRKTYVTCAQGAPGLDGKPCSPMYNGILFAYQAGRDFYTYSQSAASTAGVDDFAINSLQQVQSLTQILGVDPLAIPGLAPADRKQAYRFKVNREDDLHFDPVDIIPPFAGRTSASSVNLPAAKSGPLDKALGKLEMWDGYYVGCSKPIYKAFYDNRATKAGFEIDPDAPLYGEMFLQNLALVETFLTDAAQDLMIYAPAIPPSFKLYKDLVLDVKTTPGDAKNRYGFVVVSYKPGALKGVPTPQSRTIFFPHYEKAGHSVGAWQPSDLLNDVREWLTWVGE